MKKYPLFLSLFIFLLCGCGVIQPTIEGFPREREEAKVYPFKALRIPPGHLPPPGQCKIWFPGRPPGHQPRPQSCASALLNAPLGAWVITNTSGRYKVNIFSKTKKNVIDEVRWYHGK